MSELNLAIVELEELEAPGFWSWVGGIAAGAAATAGGYAVGVGISVLVT